MRETADSGVPSGSWAVMETGGSLSSCTEIHLVRGKKFDIFVEGSLTYVKHGT